jgi:hypothetical protein
MKRKLLFGAAFLCVAWAVTSCEALSGCKKCRDVIYENGSVVNPGTDVEYCGTELIKKEATPNVTIGALTTKVECR